MTDQLNTLPRTGMAFKLSFLHTFVAELGHIHSIATRDGIGNVRADLHVLNASLTRRTTLPVTRRWPPGPRTRHRIIRYIATREPHLTYLLPYLPALNPTPRGPHIWQPTPPATQPSPSPATPSPTEVRQGTLGDCWFVATLAACEHAKPGYTSALVDHLDPHVAKVTLGWLPGTRTYVTTAVPHAHRAGDNHLRPNAASLVEKALATRFGSYRRVQCNFAGVALWLLTGSACPARPVPGNLRPVATWLAAGRPVVASTLINRRGGRRLPREDHPGRWVGVMAGHVYVVCGVAHVTEDGVADPTQPLRVHVRNPLGGPEGEPRRTDLYLSARQFRLAFLSVNVGPAL